MKTAAALMTVAWLTGCATVAPREYATHVVAQASSGEARALTHLDLPIASGQIILSDQGRADSLLLALIADEFAPYVHAGVIAIEDGEAFVYEAFATFRPQFGGPPTDALVGRIRRRSLAEYLDRMRFAAVYDPPPGVDGRAVADYAQAQFHNRTPFDAYFDNRDPERLYCSEFVAQALQAGGAPPAHVSPVSTNRSLGVALAWLKIQAPSLIPAGTLVPGERRVALLSREYTPSQVDAYFAIKRELHQRFTADQKLGNVFRRSWGGLKLREDVDAFMREGLELGKSTQNSASSGLDEAMKSLAAQMLGPVGVDTRAVRAY